MNLLGAGTLEQHLFSLKQASSLFFKSQHTDQVIEGYLQTYNQKK